MIHGGSPTIVVAVCGWTRVVWRKDNRTKHRIYESKFILDSFIFWVFPARFLRWFAANVDFSTRSRVCTCDMFGINQGRFYKPLAFNVDFFPRSHDFSVMKFHYCWTRRNVVQIPYLLSSMFGINQVRFLILLLLSLTFSHGHVISQPIYCVVLCGMMIMPSKCTTFLPPHPIPKSLIFYDILYHFDRFGRGVWPVTQRLHFDIRTTCEVTCDNRIFQPILIDFLNHFLYETKVKVTCDIDQN